MRLGQITALRKPDGGVGIVVTSSDDWWPGRLRSKSRRMLRKPLLPSRTPYPRKQVASVSPTSYKVSPKSMLEGLMRMEQGDQTLPFVLCFHGSPSKYLW